MRTGTIVLLSVLLLSACEKNNEDFRGQVVISSAFNFDDASVYGFNFEMGERTRYPSVGEPLPDLIVDNYRLLDGSVKPGFTSPANTNGFALAGEFNDLKSSLDYFENKLDTFDINADFSPSSDTVREFQVWVLKTTLNKYAKLHVREIWTEDGVSGKYAEVMIDYYYQPDGSATFPE
ncbi:MAG: hypothetical protein P1P82_16835 [Bacteroidales bacterium]|nr:hypothetical protein [Bacteroidales bacterium]MDT8432817.1 hypothetical protein [Bacteroidales bacterium]